MGLAQNIVFGLEFGSFIAIATIGFTLIYGIVNMINFAYGEYMTIGSYLGWLLITGGQIDLFVITLTIGGGLNFWIALPVVVGLTAALGWGISRATFTPIREAGPIPMLLTSIGLGFILRNVYKLLFGVERQFVRPEDVFDVVPQTRVQTDLLGGVFVTTDIALVIAAALLAFGAIHLLLTRTDLGIAMRATASNEDLALLSGIPAYDIRQYTWVLASALAGFAGLMLALSVAVGPDTGFEQILLILAAAILGGAGSPYGAMIGSYIIGLAIVLAPAYAEDFGLGALGDVQIAVAFIILVAALLIRPSGIAGSEVSGG